jgi:hypothetical protein
MDDAKLLWRGGRQASSRISGRSRPPSDATAAPKPETTSSLG